MPGRPEWMTAREAAARLDVKLATLYAYASRGWLVRVVDASGRGSRYARSSVEQLKARHDARAGHAAVAAAALRWGEPSLETSISEIREDGPAYRGHGLLELYRSAPSFESVASLLWTGRLGASRWPRTQLRARRPPRPRAADPLAFFAAAVAGAALHDAARSGASDEQEHARAARLLRWLAQIAGDHPGASAGSVAECLLVSYGLRPSPHAIHAVDRALILCADHELNPSTFAVRVTASTGADLYACLSTGLATLSGPKHGGVTALVEALLQEIDRPARAAALVRARLARNEAIPGFGHPLYAGIDPRASALLQLAQGRALNEDARCARHCAGARARDGARRPARAEPGRRAGRAVPRAGDAKRRAGRAVRAGPDRGLDRARAGAARAGLHRAPALALREQQPTRTTKSALKRRVLVTQCALTRQTRRGVVALHMQEVRMRSGGRMRSSMARALLVFSVSWALHACDSEDEGNGAAATCAPGAMLACDCANGSTSVASCLPDGSGVGPCACNDPVVADAATALPSDSGAPPAPVPDSSAGDAGAPGVPNDAATPPPDGGDLPPSGAMRSAGCGSANPPASGSKTIDVGGSQREYIVTIPTSYDANKPHRLIFSWHGLGGRATQVASTHYGLMSRAGSSAIFIAAQGLPNPQQSGLPAWANRNDGDITLTRELIEWAKTNYCIDTTRIFSVGMSNGGMMSNIVGCELGDTFRAIAAMSGGGPRGYAMKPCVGQVAVWITHGNTDNNVPFSYGQMSRDYWRGVNNCSTQNTPTASGECVEYQGCDAGFPVQWCEFDGGHMVPRFAAESVWKFFEQF